MEREGGGIPFLLFNARVDSGLPGFSLIQALILTTSLLLIYLLVLVSYVWFLMSVWGVIDPVYSYDSYIWRL